MHISEGVLSGPVLITGAVIAVAGTAVGLKKLDYEQIAKAGMLSAAFFVASLIHVPIGPSSAHLVLNGIVGLMLGWGAFPAILTALILQAMLFQFGGITTLGVNTVIMAFPALICYMLFGKMISGKNAALSMTGSFCCGFFAVFFSALLAGLFLIFTEENFLKVSQLIVLANLPIMLIEGIITGFCVTFLKKVQPTLLPGFVAVLAIFFLSGGTAYAHKVNVFAWTEGDTVFVEAKFAGGKKVMGAEVIVSDDNGKQLLSGKTDDNGGFSFKLPPPLNIVVIAGMGHRGEWRLEAAASDSKPADIPKAETTPTAQYSSGITPEMIRIEVEKALDKKLSPILKRLAESETRGPGLSEIFGGIGYIFGLAGVAAYVQSRKKK